MIKLPMDEPDRLKNYIEKLESLGNHLPDEATILRLQKEYNLNSDDLKKLNMLVDRHNDRADIYLHRENVNSAIEELERATQLTPRNPFIHFQLAKLFKNRYENFGFLRRDRLRAQDEAKKTVNLDPSLTEANQLVQEMDLINKRLMGKTGASRPIIIIILILFLFLSLILFTRREEIRQWFFRTINPPQEVHYIPPPQERDSSLPREVEIESYGFVSSNLSLNVIKSEIAPLNDHWGYTLQGGLTSPSQSLTTASALLRFLGNDHSLLYETVIPLMDENDPPVLPGENLPVDFFFFLPLSPEEVDRITILPGQIEFIIKSDYSFLDKKVWWKTEKPDGVKLKWQERERQSFEGYDSIVHFYTIDITHKGMTPMTELELVLEWKDKYEEVKYTKTLNLVNSSGPPMIGLEQRALGFTLKTSLKEDWENLHYDVYVSKIGIGE